MKQTASLIKPVLCIALLLTAGAAIAVRFYPQAVEQLTSDESAENSKHYTVVEGSIYDGDTLRVTDGKQEKSVRLCGLDAPEKSQKMGIESRDHLRHLVAQGGGHIILVETDVDWYDRTVAEAFIPVKGSQEEIHLNSQMIADGMAYAYPKYVGSCPNGAVMQTAEETAREQARGVWAAPSLAEKPWDYRRRS